MDDLVSTGWLDAQRGARDLLVLDATYHPLEPDRDARAEFEAGHIPGAHHLDLKTLSDPGSALPSMAPSAGAFAARLRQIGVAEATRVVLYDDAPHHTAARAWWLFRRFGFIRVALLDGGLARWRADGRPIETGADRPAPATQAMRLAPDDSWLRGKPGVAALLPENAAMLVDARSPARFEGREGDPRPGVAPGHIPGSRNLRYDRLFDADGLWKRGDALAGAFAEAGVDLARPIVTTCGSGITAAVVAFGAHLAGARGIALYDGSWSEWGADPAALKAIGPA